MKVPNELRWKSTGRTLGEGGQAAVIEVLDSQDQFSGRYALKGLGRGKPPKAYERFAREVEAIKSVTHPAIIRILDHSDSGADFHFYVMELHEGARPLGKVIGSPDSPYHRNALLSLSLFIDLLSAIEACERAGIVHRDLSPENVLILPDGSIKIIDFGICQTDGNDTITLADEGIGTPNYMAPECESGSTEKITSRADIYSAGKILWSSVTNFRAFSREAPVFESKAMKSIFPDYPPTWHLHHVFEKTVRKDPGNRWRTASDALQAVRHIRYLILAQYPPIELLNDICPLCGFGTLGPFESSHAVFGNPNPRGIIAVQCNYCGFCFARNGALVQQCMQTRSKLH